MRVLGISSDLWLSSAALVEDGRVVAAAAEERFSRQKLSRAFPAGAIAWCLEHAGIGLGEVDRVAVPWNVGAHLRAASGRWTAVPRWRGEYLATIPAGLARLAGHPEIERVETRLAGPELDARVVYVDHHEAHAAAAFYLSPFERAAVLTVDGKGEEETATLGRAEGRSIEKLHAVHMPHSLGLFYGAFTQFLGFRPDSDEWKVMALASYGTPGTDLHEKVRAMVELRDDGGFELDLSYFTYYLHDNLRPFLYSPKLEEALGPARRRDSELGSAHHDLARAVQEVFEETCAHMLGHLHRRTGERDVVVAGGAAMNSVYNGRILRTTPFERAFVPSCPDDSGTSVGAALAVCFGEEPACERHEHRHNFWGPSFSDAEVRETIARYKLPARRLADPAGEAARRLADGQILGWFQGAMEFGQRALGHRSILADPRDTRAKDRVNLAVKYREAFRPFAPAVLAERAEEWFDLEPGVRVPFMEKVYPVREERRAAIPAVTHVDGSGRLQTVTREESPRFHELIRRFEEATGVPVVLNTSFNLNGEPIVCTPTDAIRTFYSCGLDALVLGDHLLEK